MPPRLLTRRLAALALDLLIAGLIVIVLISATPLGRYALLPLPEQALGPISCGPVTEETFADNPHTRLWIQIWATRTGDPSRDRNSPEVSLCHARIFGLLTYTYFKLVYPPSIGDLPFAYVEVSPVDAQGNVHFARDHSLALIAGLLLIMALVHPTSLGKHLLGLRVDGARPRLREALRSGPFLCYGLLCAFDPLVVAWLRPGPPPTDRALLEAYLSVRWFLGTPWQSAVYWALVAYVLLALVLVVLGRPAPWDGLARTSVIRR